MPRRTTTGSDMDLTNTGSLIRHPRPSVMATLLFMLARIFLKPIYKLWPLTDRGIRALVLVEAVLERAPTMVSVRRTSVDLGGVTAERSAPAESATDALPDAAVCTCTAAASCSAGSLPTAACAADWR